MTRVWKRRTKSLIFVLLFFLFIQGQNAEVYYPWKEIYIGALDSKAWPGLAFVPHPESAFAFRIRIKKNGDIADSEDLFYLVSEVGPHSPDGQYARLKLDLGLPFGKGKDTPILKKPSSKSNTLVLEWSRQDERTIVGRIKAPKGVEVHIIHYFPWNFSGKYQFSPENQITGESTSSKAFHYLFWTSVRGDKFAESKEETLILSFPPEKEKNIYFVAAVGEDAKFVRNHIFRYKHEKSIDALLKEEQKRYMKKRVKIDGFHKGVPDAITNNLFWMSLYQPGFHRLYIPAGRRWIFPKPDGNPDFWTIFEWDSFFNALEVSVESPKHAKDIIRSVLETQYPNGNIPNWRGKFGGTPDRSQPPVGTYVVLKLFQKTGDMEFLQLAYPYLVKWHDFWKAQKPNGQSRRDGNGDGLLEWGSDSELIAKKVPSWEENADGKTRAMWESGQDDLPNWDEASFDEKSGTLTMNCIDLNSLYALDSWCLAQIALILGNQEEYQSYLNEYERMKALINKILWNEKEGFYFDRHWNGRFSAKKAASNFYPLLARIPDEKRALRLLKHLLDKKEFWGDYVIPTISRNDPAFKDQQYWRGTIWPPTNYLVYQGLKAYGFDAAGFEFANKSADLFLRTWENFQICPENFDSRTGEAGGQRYQSWGPLFALIAMEEYIDFSPWEGFRFGMIKPEKKGTLSRLAIQGRHYEVRISSSEVKLKEEGEEILKANGGAVFRHFLYSENEVSFEIKSLESREVKIRFIDEGKYQYMIDNQSKKIFEGDSLKIEIPEGDHSVLILLLEKKE